MVLSRLDGVGASWSRIRRSISSIAASFIDSRVIGVVPVSNSKRITPSAYTSARDCPPLPWRVSSSGPVFRYESDTGTARLREFTQVGVELLGAGGPAADAEVIALADRSLSAAARVDATVRIGHVGLIQEVLARTGLPADARSALIEMMSAAAAEGEGIQALESVLERLTGWLRSGSTRQALASSATGRPPASTAISSPKAIRSKR